MPAERNRAMPSIVRSRAWAGLLGVSLLMGSTGAHAAASYQDLLALWQQWRTFERPALRDGAPDYSAAAVARRQAELKRYQARLDAFDADSWTREQRID